MVEPTSKNAVSVRSNSLPLTCLCLGLAAMYIGERALADTARYVVSGLGIGVPIAVGLAWLRVARNQGEHRRAAARILVEYCVCLLAVALYWLQTPELGWIESEKVRSVLQVAWPAVLLLGLAPVVAMELAWLSMVRAPQLELWRVRFAARGARIVALAVIIFAGINFVSARWNRKVDVSYFKTTKPGTSNLAMIKNLTQPVRFVAFFPPGNEVAEMVQAYLNDLVAGSPQVTVEVVDQAMSPELARELKVRANGYLAVTANNKSETLHLGLELEDARDALRDLDTSIQKRLVTVLRPPQVAYLTAGHNERDYLSNDKDKRLQVRELKTLLEAMGFKVKRLGLPEGLGTEVPEDATLVIIAGALEPFMPEERATLERYLKKGGRLLAMIDPDNGPTEDALLAPLGVKVSSKLVANERYLVRVEGRGESTYNLATNRASSHATVETINQAGGRLAVVLLGAGMVTRIDNPPESPKVTFTLRTMPESWLDKNGNGKFDKDTEKREMMDFAAAIEGDGAPAQDGKLARPMRAIVIADADVAGDGLLGNPGNGYFMRDCVLWLAGTEDSAGTVESEKDVAIVHRKDEDTIWFYGTSFLIPAGVFAIGRLVSRTKRSQRRDD